MTDRKDLLKLFGVEGMVTLKTILTETKEDLNNKSGGQLASEVATLLKMLDDASSNDDIIQMIQCIQSMAIRVDAMYFIASEIKNMIDNRKKK